MFSLEVSSLLRRSLKNYSLRCFDEEERVDLSGNGIAGSTGSRIFQGVLKTGRVAHAYLMAGSDSGEMMATARWVAQALNCIAGQNQPCGQCLPCSLIKENKFVDLIYIYPDGASIKIDQIRAIKSQVKFGPNQGKYLVVLVPSADRLTAEAANSFLKLLEEPQPGVVFILMTTSPRAIMPTIKSRCHQVLMPETSLLQMKDMENMRPVAHWLSIEDWNELFQQSKEWARLPEELENNLNQFIFFLRGATVFPERSSARSIKIVFKTIEAIKRKAASQLALDSMFLSLAEELKACQN